MEVILIILGILLGPSIALFIIAWLIQSALDRSRTRREIKPTLHGYMLRHTSRNAGSAYENIGLRHEAKVYADTTRQKNGDVEQTDKAETHSQAQDLGELHCPKSLLPEDPFGFTKEMALAAKDGDTIHYAGESKCIPMYVRRKCEIYTQAPDDFRLPLCYGRAKSKLYSVARHNASLFHRAEDCPYQ